MSPTAPPLPLSVLLAGGYLLDLNLRWAHPLGLSFEVRLDCRGQPISLVVLDQRRLPAGASFGECVPADATAKLATVERERRARAEARTASLGGPIEGVDGVDRGTLAVAGVPDEAADVIAALSRSFGADVAASLRAQIEVDGEDGEALEDLLRWLAGHAATAAASRLIAPLLANLRLDHYGRVSIEAPAGTTADTTAAQTHDPSARVSYLLREIPRLQEAYGQLYPEEHGEMAVLEGRLAEGAPAAQVVGRLEDLFGLAQPGMRLFRGDVAARDRWLGVRDRLRAEAEALFAARSEVERFVAEEMSVDELADPDGVRAAIADRLAPLGERLANLEAEVAQIRHRARPLRAALERLDERSDAGCGAAP